MAGRTFASLALLARVLASPYRCQTNPDDDLVLRGRDNATHVIPGLPRNPSDYDYAVERAFVVLPPVCVSELGLEADAAGARSTGRRFWVGRVGDAAWTWRLADCACGWVVFLHGSGGFTYDNWRYALDLASAGYGVLAPDSMGNATGARYRAPVADLAKTLASDGDYSYWCDDEVYAGGCAAFDEADGYPLCFSSDGDAIAADPDAWASYYAKVYELRRRELSRVVDWLEASDSPLSDSIWTADKLFLAGSSEGGMAASRFYDNRLHGRLSGLLVAARAVPAAPAERRDAAPEAPPDEARRVRRRGAHAHAQARPPGARRDQGPLAPRRARATRPRRPRRAAAAARAASPSPLCPVSPSTVPARSGDAPRGPERRAPGRPRARARAGSRGAARRIQFSANRNRAESGGCRWRQPLWWRWPPARAPWRRSRSRARPRAWARA